MGRGKKEEIERGKEEYIKEEGREKQYIDEEVDETIRMKRDDEGGKKIKKVEIDEM